jgi:hypothetical protein
MPTWRLSWLAHQRGGVSKVYHYNLYLCRVCDFGVVHLPLVDRLYVHANWWAAYVAAEDKVHIVGLSVHD